MKRLTLLFPVYESKGRTRGARYESQVDLQWMSVITRGIERTLKLFALFALHILGGSPCAMASTFRASLTNKDIMVDFRKRSGDAYIH